MTSADSTKDLKSWAWLRGLGTEIIWRLLVYFPRLGWLKAGSSWDQRLAGLQVTSQLDSWVPWSILRRSSWTEDDPRKPDRSWPVYRRWISIIFNLDIVLLFLYLYSYIIGNVYFYELWSHFFEAIHNFLLIFIIVTHYMPCVLRINPTSCW